MRELGASCFETEQEKSGKSKKQFVTCRIRSNLLSLQTNRLATQKDRLTGNAGIWTRY